MSNEQDGRGHQERAHGATGAGSLSPSPEQLSDQGIREWATTSYLDLVSQQIAIAIEQLQTANNWTVTVIIVSAGAVVTTTGYPNDVSLVLICFLMALTAQFTIRTLKGYINVMRWSTLQRIVVECALSDGPGVDPPAVGRLQRGIRSYHLGWKLPITRSDVWRKGLTELGLAPVWVGLVAVLLVNIYRARVGWPFIAAAVACCTWALAELVWFAVRSPYMREQDVDEVARGIR